MTKVSTVSTVSANGTTVEVDGRTQVIPWTTLRKAAEQADTELADLYRAILRDAEEMVCQSRPIRLQGTEINTNVYGVIGADTTYTTFSCGSGRPVIGPNTERLTAIPSSGANSSRVTARRATVPDGGITVVPPSICRRGVIDQLQIIDELESEKQPAVEPQPSLLEAGR
jgi:hypothetical protein